MTAAAAAPRRRWALVALGLLALAALPWLGEQAGAGGYAWRLGVIALLYVASAVGWDLVGGLAGQVSFGHAAFFGIGAYVTAILVRAGWPFAATTPAAAGAAALFAVAWGWPCLRLRGPFFAIATIGVGEAARLLALAWEPVTGGATGLTLPMRDSARPSYYSALVLAVLAFGLSAQIRRSRLGLGLSCVREDVDAAESIGIRSGRLQLQALAVSAAIVGLAGAVYAQYMLYVEPGDVFAFNRSISLILMSIIGGVNTLWGPGLGAVLFFGLEQWLAAWFPNLHLGLYGLLLLLVITFEPRGLTGLGRSLAARRRAPAGAA